MFSFEVSHESKECLARTGVLRSRSNTLTTPCVFLDTQSGLPTFLTLQQMSKANLSPHGYVLDLGDIFHLSSTDKIHSSFDQAAKSKQKSKTKLKTKTQQQKDSKNSNKNKNATNDTITSGAPSDKNSENVPVAPKSVLEQFYAHNTTNAPASTVDSIHQFTGMSEYILLLDHRNVSYREPQLGTDKFIVLNTEHGTKRIPPQEYVEHVKRINADMYMCASEDILSTSSNSRAQKNVTRTLKLSQTVLDAHIALNVVQTALVWCVQGGGSEQQREKCCDELMKMAAACQQKLSYAFCIGGVGYGESATQRHAVLNGVNARLNADGRNKGKLRVVSGLDTLSDVLLAIGNGCDVIVSSYPTQLTTNADAMVHAISPIELDAEDEDEDDDIVVVEQDSGAASFVCMDIINITDIRYATDERPILEDCGCYTCKHHSRAYLRHLWNVHEMNAQILLQMHNSYRFLQFVENVQTYLKNDKFAEFCEWWNQYHRKTMRND